jgi:hypothetical protein
MRLGHLNRSSLGAGDVSPPECRLWEDPIMSTPDSPLWQRLGTAFHSEAELAEWVYQQLDPYFVIHCEVRGTHCTKRRMRIDAVLQPREKLGWTDPNPAFGVEFKNPATTEGTKAYTKWAAQAVDYTHTEWDDYGRLLIATCPPVSQDILGGVNAQWLLVRVLGQLGVGELGVSPAQGWILRVSGERVWSQTSGPRSRWSIKPKHGSR